MNRQRVKKTAVLLLWIYYLQENYHSRRPRRRWWVRLINQRRQEQGDWHNLIREMRLWDPDMFFNYTRLNMEQFDLLLAYVGPAIKKSTSGRQPIQEGARLALTLRHLATGDSLASLAFAYRIGKSTACGIINETCTAIWEVLSKKKYIPFPNMEMWTEIENGFSTRWNLNNCIGALDGKHIQIQAPINSGSTYFNYKKYFSIVLFALCDHNYKFTFVDVGAYGSQSDGGILRNSNLGLLLFNNNLNIPADKLLPGTNVALPHYFVGDEAFPLHCNLMRPFGGHYLSREQKIFNYRLSRSRRCIENAFGIMVARFRIFHRVINAYPENVDKIVLSCVALHNFLKTYEETINPQQRKYSNVSFEDREENGEHIPGEWRLDMPEENGGALQSTRSIGRRLGSRNASQDANRVRNLLLNYVNDPLGEVPWQRTM